MSAIMVSFSSSPLSSFDDAPDTSVRFDLVTDLVPASPQAVTVAFNTCINERDLDGLADLMTDDHTFADSAGGTVQGKPACIEAWRDFFGAFPDYRNVFTTLVAGDRTVTAAGHSECSVPALAGPARWTATIRDGKVARWQVDEVESG
jgi:ketosteroid isomerase-like protein